MRIDHGLFALVVLAATAGPAATDTKLLAADTPMATVAGHTFIAPVGWQVTVSGSTTLLTAPEGGSQVALIDVEATDADVAVAAAWKAYGSGRSWPLKVVTPTADRDGWSQIRNYDYQTSPNEKRSVTAQTRQAGGRWLVTIYDMADAVAEKRLAQTALIFGQLLPKGYTRESFKGKRAHPLDAARIAELARFVEKSQELLKVPGVSIGLLQDGKVVHAAGYGVRGLGSDAKVDADTRYMIASNTKALTTLMLGRLVDEKKITWDTAATALLPSFKLGDADTTGKVLVKHLICACTGLPRQDMEWLLQYGGIGPADALATLGTMKPTSRFGELFQYSNPMAAAAGFIGGHVAFPGLELGAAYDKAMQTLVFDPLGMKATTFDYAAAQQGNFAVPHAPDPDGRTARALMDVNYSIIPVRPAGAAWSNVHDLLRYVQMELSLGRLGDGRPYVSKEVLAARQAPQVWIGKDSSYGMGLSVESRYDVKVVHHGGDMIGFHSDMMWLPEHGIGAVVLTNGDPGWVIRTQFRRKLLEVLFDGRPEADAAVAASAKSWFDRIGAERKLLTIPADAGEAGKLAARYTSDVLGEVAVSRNGAATVFDFGEWKSEVASRRNPDGTTSFVTIVPGMSGLELVVGASEGRRTLTLRDAQHEYVFTEGERKTR